MSARQAYAASIKCICNQLLTHLANTSWLSRPGRHQSLPARPHPQHACEGDAGKDEWVARLAVVQNGRRLAHGLVLTHLDFNTQHTQHTHTHTHTGEDPALYYARSHQA